MGKADELSKQLDWKVVVENDNNNQVFIKDNWICSLKEVVIEGPEVDIVEKIKRARSKNEEVVRIVEEMKKARVKELRRKEWKIEGDLVLKEGKIYVPKDVELRAEMSRSSKVDFVHFYFLSFIFLFLFLFLLFSISIFRTTQVRGYQSHCHISHNLMA